MGIAFSLVFICLVLREIDLEKLQSVAENALTNERYHKEAKPDASMKIAQKLGLLDCFVAPCVVACPVHQDIPEYIQLIAEERYVEAYALIVTTNAMPFTTGFICESACELKCVRNDYEETVRIRDLKRIASERGFDEVMSNLAPKAPRRETKVAIIGAGPAGLSSAYFLGREGFDVTVFDKTDKIGGMVRHGIADYRVPDEAIDNDIELVKKMGAKFEMNCDPKIDVKKLKAVWREKSVEEQLVWVMLFSNGSLYPWIMCILIEKTIIPVWTTQTTGLP